MLGNFLFCFVFIIFQLIFFFQIDNSAYDYVIQTLQKHNYVIQTLQKHNYVIQTHTGMMPYQLQSQHRKLVSFTLKYGIDGKIFVLNSNLVSKLT